MPGVLLFPMEAEASTRGLTGRSRREPWNYKTPHSGFADAGTRQGGDRFVHKGAIGQPDLRAVSALFVL